MGSNTSRQIYPTHAINTNTSTTISKTKTSAGKWLQEYPSRVAKREIEHGAMAARILEEQKLKEERENPQKVMLQKFSSKRIQELGLGRGIDSTNPNPWVNKLSFQVRVPEINGAKSELPKQDSEHDNGDKEARGESPEQNDKHDGDGKEAKSESPSCINDGTNDKEASKNEPSNDESTIIKNDESTIKNDDTDDLSDFDENTCNLIYTDEGEVLSSFVNEVSSIKEQQAKFDLSITAPNVPITVDTGVDMSRSLTLTQVSMGKRIHTRTIAFKATFDDTEERLAKSVLDFANIEKDGENNYMQTLKQQRNLSDLFYEFVKHYHTTHYVNSITLGASRFIIWSESEYKLKVSAKAGGGYQSVVQTGASASFVDKQIQKQEKQQSIGKMNQANGTVETEAVVQVTFEPISNLAKTQAFREPLQKALTRYIREQQNKQDGPFIISCGDSKVFLMVHEGRKPYLSATSDITKASLFYIIPINNEAYPYEFYIGWRGCHSCDTDEVTNKRELTNAMRFLQAPLNIFGRQKNSLTMESLGRMYDSFFVIQSPLTEVWYKHSRNIDLEEWLDGYNSYLIRCTKRRHRVHNGYLVVEEISHEKAAPLHPVVQQVKQVALHTVSQAAVKKVTSLAVEATVHQLNSRIVRDAVTKAATEAVQAVAKQAAFQTAVNTKVQDIITGVTQQVVETAVQEAQNHKTFLTSTAFKAVDNIIFEVDLQAANEDIQQLSTIAIKAIIQKKNEVKKAVQLDTTKKIQASIQQTVNEIVTNQFSPQAYNNEEISMIAQQAANKAVKNAHKSICKSIEEAINEKENLPQLEINEHVKKCTISLVQAFISTGRDVENAVQRAFDENNVDSIQNTANQAVKNAIKEAGIQALKVAIQREAVQVAVIQEAANVNDQIVAAQQTANAVVQAILKQAATEAFQVTVKQAVTQMVRDVIQQSGNIQAAAQQAATEAANASQEVSQVIQSATQQGITEATNNIQDVSQVIQAATKEDAPQGVRLVILQKTTAIKQTVTQEVQTAVEKGAFKKSEINNQKITDIQTAIIDGYMKRALLETRALFPEMTDQCIEKAIRQVIVQQAVQVATKKAATKQTVQAAAEEAAIQVVQATVEEAVTQIVGPQATTQVVHIANTEVLAAIQQVIERAESAVQQATKGVQEGVQAITQLARIKAVTQDIQSIAHSIYRKAQNSVQEVIAAATRIETLSTNFVTSEEAAIHRGQTTDTGAVAKKIELATQQFLDKARLALNEINIASKNSPQVEDTMKVRSVIDEIQTAAQKDKTQAVAQLIASKGVLDIAQGLGNAAQAVEDAAQGAQAASQKVLDTTQEVAPRVLAAFLEIHATTQRIEDAVQEIQTATQKNQFNTNRIETAIQEVQAAIQNTSRNIQLFIKDITIQGDTTQFRSFCKSCTSETDDKIRYKTFRLHPKDKWADHFPELVAIQKIQTSTQKINAATIKVQSAAKKIKE